MGFTSFTSLHLLNLQQRVVSLPAEACAGKAGAAAGVSWDRLVGFGKWKRYKVIHDNDIMIRHDRNFIGFSNGLYIVSIGLGNMMSIELVPRTW